MNIRLFFSFLLWVPKFFGSKVANAYTEYANILRNEPVLGGMLMLLVTVISFVVVALISLAVFGERNVAAIIGLFPLLGIPLNYFVIQVQRLFSIFTQERQELFNKLKDTK